MAYDPILPTNGMLESHLGTGVSTLIANGFAPVANIPGIPIMLQFYTLLTSFDTPADVVTDFVLPFAGTIVSWQLVTRVVATSGSTADADLELQLGATPVTGSGISALTEADLNAIGKVKAGGTITAANTFAALDTFSIVCTESATNFTAGAVDIYVYCIATALTDAMVTANMMAEA
jgi:hypothetical protein